MEGIRTNLWIDCKRNIFGCDVDEIKLVKDGITFNGPMFSFTQHQVSVCKLLNIPTKQILGVEYIKKKRKTNNWFEKIFTPKEEWIRVYY